MFFPWFHGDATNINPFIGETKGNGDTPNISMSELLKILVGSSTPSVLSPLRFYGVRYTPRQNTSRPPCVFQAPAKLRDFLVVLPNFRVGLSLLL